jgi:hypothetical protein
LRPWACAPLFSGLLSGCYCPWFSSFGFHASLARKSPARVLIHGLFMLCLTTKFSASKRYADSPSLSTCPQYGATAAEVAQLGLDKYAGDDAGILRFGTEHHIPAPNKDLLFVASAMPPLKYDDELLLTVLIFIFHTCRLQSMTHGVRYA